MSLVDQLQKRVVRGLLANRTAARLIGHRRHTGADAGLDPQIAAILELERALHIPKLDSLTPAAGRKLVSTGLSPLDPDPAEMVAIADGTAGGIPIRTYTPLATGPHAIVYFHGGGGVVGSVAGSDAVARGLADQTRQTLVSVDYRLGPEHRHPAAADDALAAYTAIAEALPAGARIAVAGDSFGGYLAAYVDHEARARGVRPPDVQCLLYPIVDFRLVSPSIDRLATGYLLTRDLIHWFRRHYFPESAGDAEFAAASPWSWPSLRGGAPAIVLTAGFDPLVDEGDAFAARLAAEGVPVRHHRHAGLVHGFISFTGAVDAARTAIHEMCMDLADMLDARG